MFNPFSRNAVNSDVTVWRFIDDTTGKSCELYSTASSFYPFMVDLDFINSAHTIDPNVDLPAIPIPPKNDKAGPFPLRTLDKTEDIPVTLAKVCWMYYPELVKTSELKKYKISKKAISKIKFEWKIRITKDNELRFNVYKIAAKNKQAINIEDMLYHEVKVLANGRALLDIF